jgi:hypothetical protein
MIDPNLLDRLSTLLGRTCLHRGQPWRLIDLLPEEGLLVLESAEERPAIQLNQFGRASHRAPDLCQIQVLAGDSEALSQELEELLGVLRRDLSVSDRD